MCSALWDPPSTSASNSIEDIQHFALKIVSKLWSQDYSSLLSELSLATLSHRWKNKIITIFKMKSNLSHVINSPLSPLPLPAKFSRHYSPYNFTPIFSRTASFHHYFFPSTIKLRNSLPNPIKSSTSLSYILNSISFTWLFISTLCYFLLPFLEVLPSKQASLSCLHEFCFFSLSLHIFALLSCCAGM